MGRWLVAWVVMSLGAGVISSAVNGIGIVKATAMAAAFYLFLGVSVMLLGWASGAI